MSLPINISLLSIASARSIRPAHSEQKTYIRRGAAGFRLSISVHGQINSRGYDPRDACRARRLFGLTSSKPQGRPVTDSDPEDSWMAILLH